MKPSAACLTCLACYSITTSLFAQGQINWANTSGTLISVNGVSMPVNNPPSPSTTYYFGLFIAPFGTPAPLDGIAGIGDPTGNSLQPMRRTVLPLPVRVGSRIPAPTSLAMARERLSISSSASGNPPQVTPIGQPPGRVCFLSVSRHSEPPCSVAVPFLPPGRSERTPVKLAVSTCGGVRLVSLSSWWSHRVLSLLWEAM